MSIVDGMKKEIQDLVRNDTIPYTLFSELLTEVAELDKSPSKIAHRSDVFELNKIVTKDHWKENKGLYSLEKFIKGPVREYIEPLGGVLEKQIFNLDKPKYIISDTTDILATLAVPDSFVLISKDIYFMLILDKDAPWLEGPPNLAGKTKEEALHRMATLGHVGSLHNGNRIYTDMFRSPGCSFMPSFSFIVASNDCGKYTRPTLSWDDNRFSTSVRYQIDETKYQAYIVQ